MSLESKIEQLIEAINTLNTNIKAGKVAAASAAPAEKVAEKAPAKAEAPAESAEKRGPGRPPKTAKTPPAPSADETKEVAVAYQAQFGKEAAKALIADSGAAKLADMTPDQRASFVAAAKAAMEAPAEAEEADEDEL